MAAEKEEGGADGLSTPLLKEECTLLHGERLT